MTISSKHKSWDDEKFIARAAEIRVRGFFQVEWCEVGRKSVDKHFEQAKISFHEWVGHLSDGRLHAYRFLGNLSILPSPRLVSD